MDYNSLYEILAMGYYNSERRPLYYEILRKFLIEDKVLKNIEISQLDKGILSDSLFIKNFARFDFIITTGLDYTEIIEYSIERYKR